MSQEWRFQVEAIMVPVIIGPLHEILFSVGLAPSKSEAIRLIKQGAVDIIRPGNSVRERQQWKGKQEPCIISNNAILQVGKRKWLKMRVTEENCNAFLEVWDLPEDIPEELERLLEEPCGRCTARN